MTEPIKSKKISGLSRVAPTPQNTPASNASSYLQGAIKPAIPPIAEDGGDLIGLSKNRTLLTQLEGRLNKMQGTSSGYIESLPPSVLRRIDGLKALHQESMAIETEFHKELIALERKYHEKYEPIFSQRAAIISGEKEVTDEQVEQGRNFDKKRKEALGQDTEEFEEQNLKENNDMKSNDDDSKGIPSFWLTALQNFSSTAATISDRDVEALEYLINIEMRYIEKPGFQLVFSFSKNPFFTNSTLTKTYYYHEDTCITGELVYDHAEGCQIDWTSPQNNLTVQITTRKQRNKHTKQTRTVEKVLLKESFFNFFSPPQVQEEEDEVDVEERLHLDYELGEEIKDRLIPRAIDWFTGQALEADYGDDFDEGFDDEEEEEEEEDDDDDDDDNNDNEGKQNKKEVSECKQS